MRKSALRITKVSLIWTVILLLTVDTSMACGLLARMRARRAMLASCCQPCCVTVDPCCAIVTGKDTAVQKPVPRGEPMLADPQIEAPDLVPEPPAEPAPAPKPPAPKPKPAKPAPKPDPPAKPAPKPDPPAADPLDDLFREPAKPADAAPAKKPPAEMKPDAKDPVDDPFSAPEPPAEPAEAAPAVEEKPAAPAKDDPLDDLFGAPEEKPAAAEEPPAAKPTAAPAEGDPLDDLFGADDAAMPAEEAPAPPVEAEKPDADPLDDLFSTEPATTEAPAVETTEPAAADPVDDLFGTPGEMPAEEPASDEPLDDLFGELPEKPAEAKPPAADDPFSAQAPRQQSLPLRRWTDNTGHYEVTARLIQIQNGKVRLLKTNGRTCTVAMRRLSAPDAQYVQRIAATHAETVLVHLAGR